MAKPTITQTGPHDSPGTRVEFSVAKDLRKFKQGHPQQVLQMQVECVKIGEFQQITCYNSKMVQDRC